MLTRSLPLLALLAVGCARCSNNPGPADAMRSDASSSGDSSGTPDASTATLTVTSAAFAEGSMIPSEHAYLNCGAGATNVSPPLAWSGAPAGTRSFALIMDDPDAPGATFTHWIAWNIGAGISSFPQGVSPSVSSIVQGQNDFGEQGYGGPCPPAATGQHRYQFRVFALSVDSLSVPATSPVAALRAALEGKILAQGVLTGTYRQ
ncbi:MAG: YbhB/YbcL family Raf kinase inhibitor-like protein [Polyangiales bacterium]